MSPTPISHNHKLKIYMCTLYNQLVGKTVYIHEKQSWYHSSHSNDRLTIEPPTMQVVAAG